MPPPAGYVVTPRAQQPIRSANDTTEYRVNYTSAEYVNALYALDNGWTGKGVSVGVIDDGVLANSELTGAIDTARSKDFGLLTQNGVTTNRNVIGDSGSDHGTAIAQVIGARRNDFGTVGYAPDVTIVALRIDDYNADTKTETLAHSEEAIRYATTIGLKIVNRSLGMNSGQVSTSWQNAVHDFGAIGGLIVNSTGNDSAADPREVQNVSTANRSTWLFVTALNPNGTGYDIASYANRCGSLMGICVTAPGSNGYYNYTVNAQVSFNGSSSATPVVAALAADILSKWPQLTGQQAGQIIMNTARDIGDPGVDAVFGRGLVDFRAALSPVNPTLGNGATQSALADSVMVVGAAFSGKTCPGGTCQDSLGGMLNDVTVLDAYGRDFTGSLSGLVVRADTGSSHWLRRRMEAQAGAGGTGWISPATSGSFGYASLPTGFRAADGSEVRSTMLTNADIRLKVGERTNVIAGFNSGDDVQLDMMGLAPSSDAMFAYSPLAQTSIGVSREIGGGSLAVIGYAGGQADARTAGAVVRWTDRAGTLKLGLVDETGTVFGTPVGAGALRFGDGATTAFLEASTGFEAGAWSFDGYASLGATRLKIGGDTLLTDAGTIASTRFGLTASRQAFGGRISLGLAQDLVALSGRANFTVGDGYDLASRSLTYGQRSTDLAGRMSPRLTFGYEKAGEHSALHLGAATDTTGQDVRAVGTWSVRW